MLNQFSPSSDKTENLDPNCFHNTIKCLKKEMYLGQCQKYFGIYFHSQHLFVPDQHWKHQNNVFDMLKVYNKDTRATSLKLLQCLYC